MNLRATILENLQAAAEQRGRQVGEISDETALLQSGLDSLGFAILVTRLEIQLGYDPFTLMESPVYPRTFGEFVALYEQFKDRAVSG